MSSKLGRAHKAFVEQLDLDLLADDHSARFEGDVPLQAPVLAVDLGLRGETDAGAAPRVADDAVELQVEVDRPRDTLDRELRVQHEVVAVVSIPVLTRVMFGNVSTSKKSGDFR